MEWTDLVVIIKDLGVPIVASIVLFNITNKLVNWVLNDHTNKWKENHDMCVKNLENTTALRKDHTEISGKIIERIDSISLRVDDVDRRLK